MTFARALHELRNETAQLSEAVTEWRRSHSRIAPPESSAVDHVAEQFSELQFSVVMAHQEASVIDGPAQLADKLPAVVVGAWRRPLGCRVRRGPLAFPDPAWTR